MEKTIRFICQSMWNLYTSILKNYSRKIFPTVEPKVCVEESCIYTLSPDWNPILDTLPAARNIVIGVGFSGTLRSTMLIIQRKKTGMRIRQDLKILKKKFYFTLNKCLNQ